MTFIARRPDEHSQVDPPRFSWECFSWHIQRVASGASCRSPCGFPLLLLHLRETHCNKEGACGNFDLANTSQIWVIGQGCSCTTHSQNCLQLGFPFLASHLGTGHHWFGFEGSGMSEVWAKVSEIPHGPELVAVASASHPPKRSRAAREGSTSPVPFVPGSVLEETSHR